MLELISQMADATSHLMDITGVRLVGCSGRRSVTAGTASNQNHFHGLRFSWTVTVILTTCLDTRVEGSNVPRPWMIHRQSVQPHQQVVHLLITVRTVERLRSWFHSSSCRSREVCGGRAKKGSRPRVSGGYAWILASVPRTRHSESASLWWILWRQT